jgi:hypothetical protein
MSSFQALVDSRRAWLQDVLIPWCRTASHADLVKAENEWTDIAGKIAPERSLWLWAWSRFPVLYVEGLGGLDESWPVHVQLRSGETYSGYPDSRSSRRGELVLLTASGQTRPLRIDEIVSVQRAEQGTQSD